MTDDRLGELDPDRRRELASEALDIDSFDDPYWLCNLTGKVNSEDLLQMVEDLREDAATLETAYENIESGEWVPEEGALFVAENANFGEYDTHGYLYENIPITESDNA